MRLPLRLPQNHPAQKWVAAAVVAVVASALAVGYRALPQTVSDPVYQFDELAYTAFYRLRPTGDKTDGSVVIVGIDDKSLDAMSDNNDFGWPWPRTYYGSLIQLAEEHGAKAVVFDLLMGRKSVYNSEFNDDTLFAEALDAAKIPVVFAAVAEEDGEPARFTPPVKRPATFGAANVTYRYESLRYKPVVNGVPSLALQAVRLSGHEPPEWAGGPFYMHYYGPHENAGGAKTFRYLFAYNVVKAKLDEDPVKYGIEPDMFRGKIVLVGAIAAGTYDTKSMPLTSKYPGVELHATAIENMINDQHVRRAGSGVVALVSFVAALAAAAGASGPRSAAAKLVGGAAALAALIAVALALFCGSRIHWLPLGAPLLASSVALVGAFAWSYFTEDRSRQFVLKAFSQYVSPTVAQEVSRDPKKLALGGERREMTVMFSDVAGFTDMSEKLPAEALSHVMNFYLDEMSKVVLAHDGTLDKYIGDAVMAFWNAPLDQAAHAELACRAALGMRRREVEIGPQLREMGAAAMYTRIGINSGPMAVGNMGSTRRFNYTVIGDSVNLGSRLEGANKKYGTQIMLSETTAALVRDRFILRPLDVIRVKGRLQPMPVYELLGEAGGDDGEAGQRMRALAERSGAAFKAYQAQRWDEAEGLLRGILVDYPNDRPSPVFLKRIAEYRVEPPGENWDGVYTFTDK